MLLPTKRVMSKYYAIVLKMHQDASSNIQNAHNLELFCDLEVMMGLPCIMLVVTLTLGSQLRQGLIKVRAKNEVWESHFTLQGV